MGDSSRRRSSELDFVAPSNELAQDEFERWKGSPIFRWGANGSILRCSPRRVPIYGGGQSVPRLKCLPGEPRLERTKELVPDDSQVASFPGPLKTKGRKKDVLAWLSSMVESLELQAQDIGQYSSGHDHLRAQEKTLLWKGVRAFVEHDGRLSGNASVEDATRQILATSPNEVQSPPEIHPTSAPAEPQPDRQAVVQQLKQHLLKGERERAVWIAVDNRLWSHAMLISSTLSSRDVWKQVVQEFVRKDVRSADHPNHSLAALYEVFAGDWEDSIDQLVPVSARSGFQMVSTADRASQPRDAMDGLNKWRETVSLILNNRSADDEKALLAMGKLLASYGRIEAAHICYLFARSVVQFSGPDDANTHFALLGFDHASADTVVPLDAILLTEVYEFGLMLASPAASAATPHLQAYKLRHAYALAELGSQAEAISYCDTIASSISSKTRISPYYHAALLAQLDDLQKRLSQSPKDTAASTWAKAKPSIGKVSKWFDNFVAGDDDATSNASGYPSDSEGPFTRNLGGTPSISRSASTTDFFGAEFNKHQSAPIPVGGNSRYAPAAAGYAPRASLEADSAGPMSSYSSSPETRHFAYSPRVSMDNASQGYGSPPSTSYSFQRQPSGLSNQQTYQPENQPSPPPSDQGSSVPDFEEQTPVAAYPQAPQQQQQQPKTNGYAPRAGGYAPPAFGGYEQSPVMSDSPASYNSPPASYQPSTSSYDPSAGGYNSNAGGCDPSAGGGYAPPSYEPSAPGPPSSGEAPKPRKKMFTDEDDDEIMARAAAYNPSHQTSTSTSTITPATAGDRAAKDAAADAAFRAAAEADAAKADAEKSKRSSSGWFKMPSLNPFGGRKQDPNMPHVHKAHMGEENSFYYDEVAKKWVNKKGGASADAGATGGSRGTPPPPRAGPPPMGNRAVSGPPMSGSRPPMGTPPNATPPVPPIPAGLQGSGPPSRMGTPGSTGSEGAPQPTGLGLQAPAGIEGGPTSAPGGAGLGPPSRPGTSLSQISNASSIDDLMGAAAPRQGGKGGTVKKGKKGGNRYVDVMAK